MFLIDHHYWVCHHRLWRICERLWEYHICRSVHSANASVAHSWSTTYSLCIYDSCYHSRHLLSTGRKVKWYICKDCTLHVSLLPGAESHLTSAAVHTPRWQLLTMEHPPRCPAETFYCSWSEWTPSSNWWLWQPIARTDFLSHPRLHPSHQLMGPTVRRPAYSSVRCHCHHPPWQQSPGLWWPW